MYNSQQCICSAALNSQLTICQSLSHQLLNLPSPHRLQHWGFQHFGASTLRASTLRTNATLRASKPTNFTDQYWSRALTLVATFQSLLRKLLNPNLLQKLTGKSLFWAKPNSTKKTYKIDRAHISRRLEAKTRCPPLCDRTAKLEAVTKSGGWCVPRMLRSMPFSPPPNIVQQS